MIIVDLDILFTALMRKTRNASDPKRQISEMTSDKYFIVSVMGVAPNLSVCLAVRVGICGSCTAPWNLTK